MSDRESVRGRGELLSSFFETYSAFANTDGGGVLLGVEELPDGTGRTAGGEERGLARRRALSFPCCCERLAAEDPSAARQFFLKATSGVIFGKNRHATTRDVSWSR